MKLVSKYIDKENQGHLVLVPDEGEDMWHTYNLISEGDRLRASTIRKVQQESATGSSSSSRIRTTLTIQVETTDFDIGGCLLRVKGRNVQENKYIKMGAYHTIDLEPNRKFTLFKEEWDSVSLERVENACDPAKHADLAAVIMQEGLAFLCLITSAMTVDRAKIEVNIPKKGKGDDTQRKKASAKFFDMVLAAILRHLNFDIIKATAIQTDNRTLIENKSKFVLCHSSSGFKHSLREVLENPAVSAKLSDTKAAGETKALQQFMTMLGNDPDRAFYGYNHVSKANESQAIETLLVSDSLFRSKDLNERKKYVSLVENVKDNGGDVKIFSCLHVSGEQLDQMTGVASILRFPVPEIEEEDHELDSD
ncbi:Protein pelota [Armadillidium nasatum]|uniref:Protein pelota homolog n=1 Tax=Armadillidium nasatum TaxID=96803 RepID=A0A5N5THU1_9CRUS|nr:Protein pelota [Armadillidium nasatum]